MSIALSGWKRKDRQKPPGGRQVPKSKLGIKRTCLDCGAKFFDLGRTPPECPKCGAVLDDSKTERSIPDSPPSPVAEEPAPETVLEDKPNKNEADGGKLDDLEDIEAEEVLGDVEDDDALIEDASDLGRDDDDISEVMEHIDEAIEDTT